MAIGVAIIGGGIFAREAHLPAVLATPALELKAIYSRSLKSAQTLKTPSPVDLYSDDSGAGKTYHDLLLRNDIQAVIIALPILSQPEHIEAALAAGKHVLSEKPIAADLKRAHKLIEYSKSSKVKGGATWGVAENFRFLTAYNYAREEIQKLGKIHSFNVQSLNYVAGGKYYETAWRKVPEYQGGFLLDGGVHTLAAIRLLLGSDAQPASLTAFTALLQKHLPPHDTINSIWQTSNGASGTVSMSFGSTYSARDITVAGEKGSVSIANDKVIVRKFENGKQEVVSERDAEWEDFGVKNEVQAWAKSLEAGKADPKQSPEQALADLELLEKMLVSGDNGGAVQKLSLQV